MATATPGMRWRVISRAHDRVDAIRQLRTRDAGRQGRRRQDHGNHAVRRRIYFTFERRGWLVEPAHFLADDAQAGADDVRRLRVVHANALGGDAASRLRARGRSDAPAAPARRAP